jgi:hypothetical protein
MTTRYKHPNPVTTECEIDGIRQNYDICSSRSIEEAQKFYGDEYKYIGSSHVLYINGVRNEFKELHYFFIRTV